MDICVLLSTSIPPPQLASLPVTAEFPLMVNMPSPTYTPPPNDSSAFALFPMILASPPKWNGPKSTHTPPPANWELLLFIVPPVIVNGPLLTYTPPPYDLSANVLFPIILASPVMLNVPLLTYTPPPLKPPAVLELTAPPVMMNEGVRVYLLFNILLS